jgi:hypothetical protein
MNWKPLFEELCFRILGNRAMWPRLLLGVVLSFLPLLNLFAFGFLYRYTNQIRTSGDLKLPLWQDWGGLLSDGLKFLAAWLIYWLLPVLVFISLDVLLNQIDLGLLGKILLPLGSLWLTLLFSAALYRMQARASFRALVEFRLIANMSKALLRPLTLPLLVFYGFYALVAPLYGLSFFIGFLLILSYTVVCLRTMEQSKRRSL